MLGVLRGVIDEVMGRCTALVMLPLSNRQASAGERDIWLIGENQGEPLGDNGLIFYRYCRKWYPDKCVYLLVKRQWPDYQELSDIDDNIVAYGSTRHMLLFRAASTYFYTHTYRDLMYRRFYEWFAGRARLVYLHHGTLGFKRFDAFYRRNRNLMDVFTVGSELERRILVEQERVDPERIVVTGYPRSDEFFSRSSSPRRQVLYMPTHRRHLSGHNLERFLVSIEDLLNEPAFLALLDKQGVCLKLCLHAHTRKTLPRPLNLPASVELVEPGSEGVGGLLRDSVLLITDYSSVAWDFMTLGRPVVFYRFDMCNYVDARDSYIDLEDPSYGPVARDLEALLGFMAPLLEAGQVHSNKVIEATGAVRPGSRHEICERIYQLAEQLA